MRCWGPKLAVSALGGSCPRRRSATQARGHAHLAGSHRDIKGRRMVRSLPYHQDITPRIVGSGILLSPLHLKFYVFEFLGNFTSLKCLPYVHIQSPYLYNVEVCNELPVYEMLNATNTISNEMFLFALQVSIDVKLFKLRKNSEQVG